VVDDGSTDDTKLVCNRYQGSNISSASAKMLIGAFTVQRLEQGYIPQHGSSAEKIAYQTGGSAWIKFFGDRLPDQIMRCFQCSSYFNTAEVISSKIYRNSHQAIMHNSMLWRISIDC
jgi:glycosyltransferase involved in cell wall biosynthesis